MPVWPVRPSEGGAFDARLDLKPYHLPDSRGHFGKFGGSFVAETLVHALDALRDAYARYRDDPEFQREFAYELEHFVGRPGALAMGEAEKGKAMGEDAVNVLVVELGELSSEAERLRLSVIAAVGLGEMLDWR